jgi:nucleotide-binding universal stress UspA family protein
MTYATLMVHLEVGSSNTGVLQVAAELADRFHAGVIGIAGGQPLQPVYSDGTIPADLIEKDLEELDKLVNAAEAEFRSALQKRVGRLEWRSTVGLAALSGYVAHQARSADLVVTCMPQGGLFLEPERHVNVGDLVMQVGRPVLVVPAKREGLNLDRALIGWNDTRESRRSVIDSLPFLKAAKHVAIAEIADKDKLADAREHLKDVVAWLKNHGVAAQPIALASTGDDALQLDAIAEQQDVGLMVAGAYGHSRLREWVLGGVTRDLLMRAHRYALVSH